MSTTVTDQPLHEIVLKILFFEDTEKAARMTAENVLWKIDNPEISERQVREVLDWLVRQKKVELYLGKYSLDRIEFLEQKELFETSKDELSHNKPKQKAKPQKTKTYYLKPKQKDNSKLKAYLFFTVILVLIYVTYSYLKIDNSYGNSNKEITTITVPNTVSEQPKLYVSAEENYAKSIKSVSYSFAQQNKINTITLKEINNLQTNLDSINKVYQKEIIAVNNELKRVNENTNNLITKIIIGNICFLVVALLFFFKNK